MFARNALVVFLVLLLHPALLLAECQMRDENWFTEHVCRRADLVALGEVRHSGTSLMRQQPWTQVAVHEVLSSGAGNRSPQLLVVRGWDARNSGDSSYGEGARVLLWLSEEAGEYRLAEDDHASCLPSVWPVRQDGRVFRPYVAAGQPGEWVAVEAVRDYLEKPGLERQRGF